MTLKNPEGLRPLAYDDLPNWRQDSGEGLLKALLKNIPGDFFPASFLSKLRQVQSSKDIYRLIEQFFTPYTYSQQGLFTGYYEPLMEARRTREKGFQIPFYRQPDDLIYISDLGDFREDLQGKRLGGKIVGTTLKPYWSRAEIYQNVLKGKNLEIAWVKSKVDAFFADVQGSLCLSFPNGERMRLHYKATNGHVYRSIGKYMIEKGYLSENNVSMQSIKTYIKDHPDLEDEILCHNPSFVFFEEVQAASPIGTLGCELTAVRSMAVDPQYIPLGSLLWLDCPIHETIQTPRLMVAQDTGGAIKGKVRGDIFVGSGESAGEIAGILSSTGTYYLFIPKTFGSIKHEK